MKKLVLLLAAFITFCVSMPQTEASGGAVGIVIKEGRSGWCEPFMLPDNDPLRTDVISIAKKYVPYGYNITCNQAIDRQYYVNVSSREEEKPFAKAYGYDFLIVLTIEPYVEPDTIHYKNRWYGNFDVYDADAGVQMAMVDLHCDKDRHFFNLGSSYRSKQGETKKYAVQQALLKALDGVLDYCGDRIKEDLANETRQAKTESDGFYGQWYKGE